MYFMLKEKFKNQTHFVTDNVILKTLMKIKLKILKKRKNEQWWWYDASIENYASKWMKC